MPPVDDAQELQRLRAALAARDRVHVPNLQEPRFAADANGDATKEADALASGTLEQQSQVKEQGRTERFRDHVSIAILILFWIGFIALLGAALLWAANFLLPTWGLLDETQSSKIFSFLTGGGLTGFVTGYAKKRLM